MAFAKIAKRNNKNTIQTAQSRHCGYNKMPLLRKSTPPSPCQATAKFTAKLQMPEKLRNTLVLKQITLQRIFFVTFCFSDVCKRQKKV